ncbi:alpha/beta fold hydrolase [Spirosoma sp. HMF4905]|uniref:Alpha/beta fold hydrolase n=1 Tax=Spirosoma arboris TaxID=2682092 RepID=A0A7K1SI68_9BACT|nr:alpha/beta hydrolase [Spirosoma arboris]MVM33510.1 alpha/beta fold hydrolase [Spirosoma arboris]
MKSVDKLSEQSGFHSQQLSIEGTAIHAVTAGQNDNPAILFLHGFPQNWMAFRNVMTGLAGQFYVVAIDLPGIGESEKIPANDTRTIARYVKGVIAELGLTKVTLVGHDLGGMVTYAFLRAYPNDLSKAVIMNVVVPGVEPWSQVKKNPHIWHFPFHSIPDLPEALVMGKQRIYFDYFFTTIAAKPDKIEEQARNAYAEAYSSYDALHTGFEWYRAFGQDEKDNVAAKGEPVQTPLLYLRGEREYGKIDDYLTGFRESGLTNVSGQVIPGSGHYAPEEASEEVVNILLSFIR